MGVTLKRGAALAEMYVHLFPQVTPSAIIAALLAVFAAALLA
jgi:hypothetical protein